MRPLLDLNFADRFWADNGTELLTNGNFEGAAGPPPAGWTQANCFATREAGTRTGGQGGYVGQDAFDGVNAIGYMQQTVLTVNRRYHPSLFGRSVDGVGAPVVTDSVNILWNPGAVAWTAHDVPFVAAGTSLRLACYNLAVGRAVQFDDVSLQEQFLYTRNRGLLGQTPPTQRVQLGDGRTAASFPTMLPPTLACRKGMNFDGNQYMLWPNAVASGTYTACFLLTHGTVSDEFMLDCRAGGGTGWLQFNTGVLAASSGTTYANDVQTNALASGPVTFVAVSGITLVGPSGMTLLCSNTYFLKWVGKLFGFRLYPGSRTPRELSDIRQRMLAEAF